MAVITSDRLPDFQAVDAALEAAPSDNATAAWPGALPQPATVEAAPFAIASPARTMPRVGFDWGARARTLAATCRQSVRNPRLAAAAIAVTCVAATGVIVAVYLRPNPLSASAAESRVPAMPPVTTGTATVSSHPSGLDVLIGGTKRGVTPVTLTLPAGDHQVEIGSGAGRRSLAVNVAAGATSSYYVEMPVEREAAVTGRLEIVSEPAGAQVAVDGVARGAAPLTLAAIASGEHSITISQNGTTLHRKVTVAPGAAASVVVSGVAGSAAGGWVSISAPFEMKVLERGVQVGTTASRLMVPAGPHRFDLVNSELEFSTSVSLTVGAGATATATVTPPAGLLSINALPWADVSIDGKPAGTTPLGNLAVAVGSHEVVWRHPQFGERRRTVMVTANKPARVGVDFNQ